MGPKFKGLTTAIMAFIVGTGVAYGLPHSSALSSHKLKQPHPSSSKAHGSDQSLGSEGTESPDPEETPAAGDEAHSDARKGSHGAAVSTAAHCAIKGSAHGALVSSVASKPGVTVAQARSACASAKAAVAVVHGKSAEAHKAVPGKSHEEHGKGRSAHGSKAHPSEE